MELRNCKHCNKMFNYIGKPICPSCEKELEDKFQEVKQYIKDHKDAPINIVAEENNVSVNQIKRWVRQERLSFADASMVGLECENCGALIKIGRFCEQCKLKLQNNLSSAIKHEEAKPTIKQKESARMRYLDGK